ncbi:MAG: O-acetyl-ADP-ribose deacetylase [Povalibacter sp.]
MSQVFLNGRVQVTVGDITQRSVDAIVNAANSTLLGGGGVDGAIHAAGGPKILEACREIRRTQYPRGLPSGEAVITTGGLLQARFVIHTVGPVWEQDAEPDERLASCYRRSLELAAAHEVRQIAFPAISTGVYGFPKDRAAAIASQAIQDSLVAAEGIERVHLVFFGKQDADLFVRHQRFLRI